MPTARDIAVVLETERVREAHAAGRNAWWLATTEVLDHLRVPYRRLESVTARTALDDIGVLVFPVPPRLSDSDRNRLATWVAEGGAVLTFSGPGDLAQLCGVTATERTAASGHVRFRAGEVWTQRPDIELHALGGTQLSVDTAHQAPEVCAVWSRTTAADATASEGRDGAHDSEHDDGAAITVRAVGHGVAIACGVDVWQSIVRIQQGFPVEVDGKPASDGTAPIDDGILKCEDGLALDFECDRAIPPGEPELPADFEHVYPPPAATPMFHRPQADLWKAVFQQCLWYAAERVDAPLPWLDYWPAGVPAVAHLSHDSDQNVEEDGRAALETFAEADVRVTWCQVFPGGYEPGTYADITAAGHEQALHYNAMGDADIARWGWPCIRAQYAWAQAVSESERIVSNKNHYTRWEGWTEFYQWCERLGIEIDESRGPSKQGSVGFTFGTAHVSYPMADVAEGNRPLNVLALPLHTQDLAWAGHEANRDVILDGAESVHGVAHFLFHGPHLRRRPAARKACLELVHEVRRRGLPWWTAGEINRWERARRGVDLAFRRADTSGNKPDSASATWLLETWAAEPVDGAAILLPPPSGPGSTSSEPSPLPTLLDGEGELTSVYRHGRHFVQLAVDIPAGRAGWTLTW